VFALLFGGILLFTAGLVLDRRIIVLALLLFLPAGPVRWPACYRLYRTRPETWSARTVCSTWHWPPGCWASRVFLGGRAHRLRAAVRLARELGLWLFLVPVVFLVSHRMIPFFSQSALMNYIMVRPAWGPSLMAVCVTAMPDSN